MREHAQTPEEAPSPRRRSTSRSETTALSQSVPTAPELSPVTVSRLSALAGNRAVADLMRWPSLGIQRDGQDAGAEPAAPPKPAPRHTWVFIMGTDPPGSQNLFYTSAKAYYDGLYGAAANSHVQAVTTLQQVLSTVNTDGNPVGLLIVVSHGHPDGRLMFDLGVTPDAPPNVSLPTTAGGGTPTQYDTTKAAVDQGKLSTPKEAVIDAQTKIMIKGCNIGRSPRMVALLKNVFGGRGQVTASTHAQEFGDAQEHLAEYYVERPGKVRLGPAALAGEFETKYGSHVTNMDAKAWRAVASTVTAETDQVDYEAFRGLVPAPTPAGFASGFSAELAGLTKQGATSISFIKRTDNGTQYDYEFGYKQLVNGAATVMTSVISVEVPPDDATAIKAAKDASGRPDAYEYSVKKSTQGKETVVTVTAKRTEWKVKHTVIKDKSGKPIPPPATSDTFWYTETPAPAPAPTP